MGYRQQLETRIREAYSFICEHQKIIQVTNRPEEKLDSERRIERHWAQIEGCLHQYLQLCQRQQVNIPNDLAEVISARFPHMDEHTQVYASSVDFAQSKSSHEIDIASSISLAEVRNLREYYEVLNEWKELHNLLQEVMTSLDPLIGALQFALDKGQTWDLTFGLLLWRQVCIHLRRLESFAREVRYIDEPFDDTDGKLRGFKCMAEIAPLQRELDSSLNDGDATAGYSLAIELSAACLTHLYKADKRLRDIAGEICTLSSSLLRSIEQ
jgi:hypothetical protein